MKHLAQDSVLKVSGGRLLTPRSQFPCVRRRLAVREPDIDLLRRYIDADDADAFAGLVQRYSALVYHTCLRVLADPGRAEDAAQDTFYRLMRDPEKVNYSLPAWLHRVATRCSIDILRSEGARRKRELAYQKRMDARRSSAEPWASVSNQIDEALACLSGSHRSLLVEHFLNGKPQAQLARETGVSKATMSRRTEAALAALRKRLGSVTAGGLAAVLGGLHAQASAGVPATLSVELCKMSLVSGAAVGPAAAGIQIGPATLKHSTAVAVTCTVTAMAVVVLGAMVVLTGGLQPLNAPRGAVAFEGAAEIRAAVVQTPRAGESSEPTGLIYLRRPGASLRSDHILAYMVEGDSVSVVFADSHVRTMPIGLARPLIEKQAGATLGQLSARHQAIGPRSLF